jgi:hypothetical protein
MSDLIQMPPARTKDQQMVMELEHIWKPQVNRLTNSWLDSNETYGASNALDRDYGVDAVITISGTGHVEGMGLRCQPGKKSWNTFTIRTGRGPKDQSQGGQEYDKRLKQIEIGDLQAVWTCQIYIYKNTILNIGIAYTEEIIKAIASNKPGVYERFNPDTKNGGIDPATFMVVPWSIVNTIKYKEN